ncbi:PhoH family protein [Schleiferilactobacillus harbinensis]|uniref:PhoH family protein n=1 Tax=Schleiferilactobacillus harbinensis TaxID=304207 RepID=UPI00117207F7|nr:PhoH family protein [Schleiferilactobacillus harbinensis]GEK04986.1 phosphate starvation protein PhoH [Schleiferilactobacillus harbinensis]
MAEATRIEETYHLSDPAMAVTLMGVNDKYLQLLAEGLNVSITARDVEIHITGEPDDVHLTEQVLNVLTDVIGSGIRIGSTDVMSAIKMAERGTLEYFTDLYKETIIRDAKGRNIRVKTFGQRQYVQTIRHNDITFGIGPAGTGKTYLAVALAVAALKSGDVERLILTRPAVEAGESLGFLPGDLKEKVDPYLRPIYDALYQIMGTDQTNRMIDRGVIEIAPLAYMRGRTLDQAFIIMDEAQNATRAQMKMLLTRLGFDSKMVVDGDITQIDLPSNSASGLMSAEKILHDIPHIGFVHFNSADVVRHPVVARIIDAYAAYEMPQHPQENGEPKQ